MASFSPKNYFKKIQSPDVLVAYYAMHNIQALFEISEQTPRKQAVEIMYDFYLSLTPEQKYDIERELALIHSLSTKYAPEIFVKLLSKKGVDTKETLIECVTDHDKVLYYYVHHKEAVDEVFFVHDFYTTKGYMLYEAKEVSIDVAEMNLSECAREFKRIAQKEDRVTECSVTTEVLDGVIYFGTIFDGSPMLTPSRDKETGEIDRKKTTRKIEEVRVVYLPKDKEVLISYTGGKQEKLLFLDTFLRTVCDSSYEDKEQLFDFIHFKDEGFDFFATNKGVPLMTWKIKSIGFAFGDGKVKNKVKLSLPSGVAEQKLTPLYSTIKELGIGEAFKKAGIESIALQFAFTHKENSEKSVKVGCTVTSLKTSLSPLLPYDRYARTLLKLSGIDKGFVEKVVKVKEEKIQKWEV